MSDEHLEIIDNAQSLEELERMEKNSLRLIKGYPLVHLTDRIQKRKEELWQAEQDKGEAALLAAFDAEKRHE